MLTAFNYYELDEESRIRKDVKDSALFHKELEIAKEFVENSTKEKGCMKECPICGNSEIGIFYEKWGVEYWRCNHCYSIFANVDESADREYKKLPALITLRTSKEYQSKAFKNRKQMWNELFDWLRFRTYRYLGKNKNLSMIDYGTRYQGLVELLNHSDMCGEYELKNSILYNEDNFYDNGMRTIERADVVLCLDYIQSELQPFKLLKEIRASLKKDGLLFLSTRVGSGFDILILKENNVNVFPYEHIMLPSKEGLKIMLDEAGFELLEITTPGNFDWNYIKANKECISKEEYFLQYFLNTATPNMETDFQRFLQKSGVSSYAQVVAKLK